MSAQWEELGLEFTPEPTMAFKWAYPDDHEIARLRTLVREQADWWATRYEVVCAENRRLRERLTLVEQMLDV